MTGEKRARRGALFIAATGAVAAVAIACGGDWSPQTKWRPEAGIAMLSPANDSRTNFVLLMADRIGTRVDHPDRRNHWVPIELSWGEFAARLRPETEKEMVEGTFHPANLETKWGLSADSRYEWGGNFALCHSNLSGAADFTAAVKADRSLPTTEATPLIAARDRLAKACDKAGEQRFDLPEVKSTVGRGYAEYVEGARLFYAEAFEDAAPHFARAAEAKSPWVRETARYMAFRNALVSAIQKSAGEYGDLADPSQRDKAAIDAAEAARLAYLKAFPSGRYAASAKGLARRVTWLRGDEVAKGQIYSAMLAAAQSASDGLPDLDLMQEIDLRLLPSPTGEGITDPVLLAISDLMRLRTGNPVYDSAENLRPSLTRAELDRQKPIFAREPELYSYLLAAEAYFGRGKPAEVLSLIPDAARQSKFSYLQFSRQMLRGLALEAVKDRNTRAFWVSLLPGAVQPYQRGAIELAIYQHDRAAGVVGRLLETGSPVLHPLVRSRIIEIDATAPELRRVVKEGRSSHEREVALYMLLGNGLRYGQYREFLSDQRMVAPLLATRPKGATTESWSTEAYDPSYHKALGAAPIDAFAVDRGASTGCPTLSNTATALAANAEAVRPLLCLAEFIRGNGFDNWDEFYNPMTGRFEPNRRKGSAGQPVNRARIYQMVIDSQVASDDDKAFALNRAIRCYQPSGVNDCGGEEVPQAARKAWFQRLKTRYPNSSWAKELKYYW